MRRPISRSLVFVIALASAESLTAAQAPRVDPEHARLIALAGTWDVEMTFKLRPDGPGIPTKGTSTIRTLLGGLFIEEKIEGALNGTPFTTLAWTGFNTSTKQYEATRIASTNSSRIAETGRYDEATRTFELKADYPLAGDTWHQRTVIEIVSADAMVATSYLSFGAVPEWKAVEIKYTRRPSSAHLLPDRREENTTRDRVIALGMQHAAQFALEEDGLNAGRATETFGYRAVLDHIGRVATGFMMSTSALERSERMGAAGDPPLALRKSIDLGMATNPSGQHVDYLEIYEPDVTAPDMQSVLRYGASLFRSHGGSL
jgi:hypothetical protein